MEIVFLGTSGSVPNKTRNLPSLALIYNGKQILVDAGEDVQRRFEDASLKFNAPLIILISHMHGDHVIGLPGLLFHFSLIKRTEDVVVYGPKGIYSYLLSHKLTLGLKAPFLKNVIEIDAENKRLMKYSFNNLSEGAPIFQPVSDDVIYENNKIIIKIFPVLHSIPSYGFKFIERPLPGTFDPQKAKKYGIPMGILWKKLQQGETIKFKNQLVDPVALKIIGDKREGITISYSSDTKICDELFRLAQDSDIFICESTYTESLRELADEKKHMTAHQCAEVAQKSNVNLLVLTHFSTRYSKNENLFLDDVKGVFENTILAFDLLRIEAKVSKDEKIIKVLEN